MTRAPTDLLYGTLDVLVLKTLTWGPRHGYAISAWIGGRTGGTLAIDDAALYKALHRLEQEGGIAAEWGLSENNRRAKYYSITARGRACGAPARRAARRRAAPAAASPPPPGGASRRRARSRT